MFSSLLAGPSFLYDHPECFLFPHITVWGSCFSLGTRRCFRIPPRRLTPQSHHAITLITAQLITSLHHTNLSPHSLSPYFSHPTHTTSSHQLITTQPLTLLLTSNSHHFITPTYHHTASHPNSHIQLLTAIRYHHTSHSHSSQHRASDHCTTQIIVHRLRLTYYYLEQVYIRYMISLFFPRLDFYM